MRLTGKRVGLILFLVVAAGIIVPNALSLYEGLVYYVRYALPGLSSPINPPTRNGPYASLYDLVPLRNDQRYDYLRQHLQALNVRVVSIPIPSSSFSDLFVPFATTGPYTVFSAHYDKSHDDPAYQGASDNTAAVSVLLASASDLARRGLRGPAAFLFTGEEETGLYGAQAFVQYARSNGIAIRAVVNFDSLGRGNLAIRPSADVPGFVFTIPFVGDVTYDGREMWRSPPYPPADEKLTTALLTIHPGITVFQRFTALTDSNVYQENGIETVPISGDDMRYLDLTWETYADRVELLDQRNLDQAYALILQLAR